MANRTKVAAPPTSAVQPGDQHQAAQQHRDDEARQPHQRQRLAAVAVALLRPIRREQHPQQSRPGVGDRHPEIGDPDLAPDRRHHRLQARCCPPRRRASPRRAKGNAACSARSRRRVGSVGRRASKRSRVSPGGAEPTPALEARREKLSARGHLRGQPLRRRPGNLPTGGAFANARSFAGSSRRFNAHFDRPNHQGPPPFRPPRRAPCAEPAAAIPARVPEASGDGRLDHPVEPNRHRQGARPGRVGQNPAVRRIWSRRRHLHPADPREARRRMRLC